MSRSLFLRPFSMWTSSSLFVTFSSSLLARKRKRARVPKKTTMTTTMTTTSKARRRHRRMRKKPRKEVNVRTKRTERKTRQEISIKFHSSSAVFARNRATLQHSVGKQKPRAKANWMDPRGEGKETTEEVAARAT